MKYNQIDDLAEHLFDSMDWKGQFINVLNESKIRYDEASGITSPPFDNIDKMMDGKTLTQAKSISKELYENKYISKLDLIKLSNIPPNNSLLFFGSIGSGKSLLRELICESSNSIIKVIDLMNNPSELFEDYTRKYLEGKEQLNEKIGEKINQLLDGELDYINQYEKSLLIVIDTLEDFLVRYNQKIDRVICALSHSTKYNNIRWLITTSNIASVVCDDAFARISGFQFSPREKSLESYSKFSDWYNLDRINFIKKLGSKIWSNLTDDVLNSDQSNHMNHFSPALVKSLADSHSSLPLHQPVDIFLNLLRTQLNRLDFTIKDESHLWKCLNALNMEQIAEELLNDDVNILDAKGSVFSTLSHSDIEFLVKNKILSLSVFTNPEGYVVTFPFLWSYMIGRELSEKNINDMMKTMIRKDNNSNSLAFQIRLIYLYYKSKNHSHSILNYSLELFDDISSSVFLLDYLSSHNRLKYMLELSEYISKSAVPSSITTSHLALAIHKCTDFISTQQYPESLIDNLSDTSHIQSRDHLNYCYSLALLDVEHDKINSTIKNIHSTFLEKLLFLSAYSIDSATTERELSLILEVYEQIIRDFKDENDLASLITIVLFLSSIIDSYKNDKLKNDFVSSFCIIYFKCSNIEFETFTRILFCDSFLEHSLRTKGAFSYHFINEGVRHYINKYDNETIFVMNRNLNGVKVILDKLIEIGAYDSNAKRERKIERKGEKYRKAKYPYENRKREVNFWLRASLHKRTGSLIRKLITNGSGDKLSSIKLVVNIFDEYLKSNKPHDYYINLSDGLLYCFRHIDLVDDSRKSQLPTYLRPLIEGYYRSQIIYENFIFIDEEEFISNVRQKADSLL